MTDTTKIAEALRTLLPMVAEWHREFPRHPAIAAAEEALAEHDAALSAAPPADDLDALSVAYHQGRADERAHMAARALDEPLPDASPPAVQPEPVATLWQHSEQGRTRIVMADSIADCDARWFKVGDLVLAAPSAQAGTVEGLTDAQCDEIARGVYLTDYPDQAGYDRALIRAALASRTATEGALTDDAIDKIILSVRHDGLASGDMRYLRRVVRAALASREAQPAGWQPIETAPKDGSEFLGWWTGPNETLGVVMTYWLDNTKTSTPWAGWRSPSMKATRVGTKPTHWMPLPTPPASKEGDRG